MKANATNPVISTPSLLNRFGSSVLLRVGLFMLITAASTPEVWAQSTFSTKVIGPVLFILVGVAFLWGIVLVQQGWAAISRGEEGALKIIGGLGMAATPFILWAIYTNLGFQNAAFDPAQLNSVTGI